jgi:hypothetical protein
MPVNSSRTTRNKPSVAFSDRGAACYQGIDREGMFMSAFHRARRLRSAALLVFVALSVALVAPPVVRADAAQVRTASVVPASNLGDQVARVAWHGFRPTREDGTFGVTILECRLHPKSVTRDCNTAETFPLSLTGNQASGITQANGTGDAFIDVESTARLPALACSHSNPCSLLVYENTPEGFDPEHLPSASASARLEFRENTADCPPPKGFDVRVETEQSGAAALYQWAADLCSAQPPFSLDVTNTSSDAARNQFFLKHVDVGVSSLPPAPGETPASAPAYTAAPLDLTALVVAYNIVDPVTGHQITDVTLTPRLVARLVSDSDTLGFFFDPEFMKLNPHHTFPNAAADPGVRGEQNADTWVVTNWLNGDASARSFLDGRDPYQVPVNDAWLGVKYPTNVFEARNPNGVYLPRTGEEDIALRLFHSTKPADGVPTNPADVGFFSILDLPTALRFNLPIARLTTGVGKPVVMPTTASISAGYAAMKSENGFSVATAAPSDPQAWPLVKVDHALVPTGVKTSDPRKAQSIQRLLAYAAGPGQTSLPAGFVPLPQPLAAQTLRAASALFVPPPTTTTTVVPTTTTLPGGGSTPFVPGPISPSYFPAPLSGSGGTDGIATAAGAPRAKVRRLRSGPTTTVPFATPQLLLASAGGERFAIPVILSLGTLAFAFALSGIARRRTTSVIRSVRRRRMLRKNRQSGEAQP